jgi:hypothetical protein
MTPSPITGTGTIGTTNAQNSPSDGGSHSYTVVSGDLTKQVILANTFTALSVPQATTTFGAGTEFLNTTKSAVTATPTTSTVNGLTSIKLGANQFTDWMSDGTNWLVGLGLPQPATQTGTTILRDDMTWVSAPMYSATTGWVATANPNLAPMVTLPANATVTSIEGRVMVAVGATATIDVYKAASTTPCASGTKLNTTSFNANGTAGTNQVLGNASTTLLAHDTICLSTANGSAFTSGTGIGGITVNYTIP